MDIVPHLERGEDQIEHEEQIEGKLDGVAHPRRICCTDGPLDNEDAVQANQFRQKEDPLPKEHRSIDIYIACPW